MKKIFNIIFVFLVVPVALIAAGVLNGANVWVAVALVYGLPAAVLLALGVGPSFLDWLKS